MAQPIGQRPIPLNRAKAKALRNDLKQQMHIVRDKMGTIGAASDAEIERYLDGVFRATRGI